MFTIPVAPLSKTAFAPFGEAVEIAGVGPMLINQGFAERFNDLANVDVSAGDGNPNISLFVCRSRPMPVVIEVMERHPLGSQLFLPLQDKPWLALVCSDPDDRSSYRAFLAAGNQGVNYARNTWHHPLLVLDDDSRFLVVDRKGPGDNLEEVWLSKERRLQLDMSMRSTPSPTKLRQHSQLGN